MTSDGENKPDGVGNPNPVMPLVKIACGAIGIIAALIILINNFEGMVRWSLPIKGLALLIGLIVLISSSIFIKNKDYKSGFFKLIGELFKKRVTVENTTPELLAKTVRLGSGGFSLLVVIAYIVSVIIPPPPPPPPFSEKLYYMVVLDASADMKTAFDGSTKWEAAQDAVQKILGDFNDHSNYGLVLIGGQESESNDDPCQLPSESAIPLVKNPGIALPHKKLLKASVLDLIDEREPLGGGSFGKAFSLAQFQLQDLPEEMIKTMIFITGSGDGCASEDEWDELLRKIETAKEQGIKIKSEIIILDDTGKLTIEDFVNRVNVSNQDSGNLAGGPPVNVQVVHNDLDLERTISIVIQNVNITIVNILVTEVARTPRSPSQVALLNTEIAIAYPYFTSTVTEAPTASATFAPIPTFTSTKTNTKNPTPTRTLKPTATCDGTCPPTFTPTQTFTFTPTPTCNGTCTPTCTPTQTRTRTPTPTCNGTCTPISTRTPIFTLPFPSSTFSPIPTTPTPIPTTLTPPTEPSATPTPCLLTCTAGVTAICNDCSYSYAEHHTGTCSGKGGVKEWCDLTPTPSSTP